MAMLRVHDKPRSEEVAEALRSNGFCLISGCDAWRGIEPTQYDTMEERRFALSRMTKNFMTPINSGVQEAGFSFCPNKEVFHFSAFSRANKSPETMCFPMGAYWHKMRRVGQAIFDGVNAHVLNQLNSPENFMRRGELEEHVFPDDESYRRWISAVEDSDRHVLSSFRYLSTNTAELHAAAHVDKGVLTICENPNDLEVSIRGTWVALGPQPAGTFAVLVGYSMERATGGIFSAVRHRVRNNGERRSRVMKIRFSPHLVLYPPSVIGSVEPRLRDEVPDPTDSISVEDMLESFSATHESVNAPGFGGLAVADVDLPGEMGSFSNLPTDLLYYVFDWLRDIRDLSRLSSACRSLRVVARSECLAIPASESNGISWDYALDQIGPNFADLGRVADQWLAMLGAELTKKTRRIVIRVRDMTGEETHFTISSSCKLGKMFIAYAQRKGVSVSSLRFLLGGMKIENDETPYSKMIGDGDQICCRHDLRGD